MPIWYTFYTFICLREQIFKNSIAREASFQEALALAERREVEKKGSILPLPHQAYAQPTLFSRNMKHSAKSIQANSENNLNLLTI